MFPRVMGFVSPFLLIFANWHTLIAKKKPPLMISPAWVAILPRTFAKDCRSMSISVVRAC